MKKSENASESAALRQKAEDLLKKKSEDEILALIEELAFQNEEKGKRAAELVIANKELAFQNEEKGKRAAELVIANIELAFQNEEKAKRADELSVAIVELTKLTHEHEVHQLELKIQQEELIQAKEQIEIEAQKFTELYDFAPSGYYTLYKDGNIIELNLPGAKMFGKDRQQLINNQFGFFLSEETIAIYNHFFKKVWESSVKESCEVTIKTMESQPLHVFLSGIVAENGEQCHITAVDITERKLAEEEIILKNDELRKINAEKDKFFSIIAHDVRGPFSGFLGLTEIMDEELPSLTQDEIQMIAKQLRGSAKTLFRLLENLLEWSRSQQGLINFEPKTFFLQQLIADCLYSTLELANKKGIAISYDIPDALEVLADGHMLSSVIRNIVNNALKFSNTGDTVSINAILTSSDSVEITVQDTGIGMNSAMVENLFRLDVQSNRVGTDGEPSTGLGLILCKQFIERHGGKLLVMSEEGKGSAFSFKIPGKVNLIL